MPCVTGFSPRLPALCAIYIAPPTFFFFFNRLHAPHEAQTQDPKIRSRLLFLQPARRPLAPVDHRIKSKLYMAFKVLTPWLYITSIYVLLTNPLKEKFVYKNVCELLLFSVTTY